MLDKRLLLFFFDQKNFMATNIIYVIYDVDA